MTAVSQPRPLQVMAGVEPASDNTSTASKCWSFSDKVRFVKSLPQKLGGWISVFYSSLYPPTGLIRRIFSLNLNGIAYAIIGSNTRLYSFSGNVLNNISPLQAVSVAAANSLATHYTTLAANPIGTVNGSGVITVTDTEASLFRVGDTVTLSGAATTNGILNTLINGPHSIMSIVGNTYTFSVAGAATSTGSGGGAAVVRSSGLMTLTKATHGLTNGARVKVSGAVASGGISAPQINTEFQIRNVVTNTFNFMTGGTATSAVTAAGGASTVYFPELAAGAADEGASIGYGAGFYGVGLYGTALTSNTARSFPRIWFIDRFGNTVVATPGNAGGVYTWDGNNATAPVQIAGAPTDVNYLFVSNNILVTLGGEGVSNRIIASDQNNDTIWTSSSTNQVFRDDVEGAGRLLGHIPVTGSNLLFTANQTYSFRYIGLPNVWEILPVDLSIGLIAPLAGVSVGGNAYWMGLKNFYMYRGANVEVIPSNVAPQSTLWRYVFDNINASQKSKTYGWYNEAYNEIWWHYARGTSNEPNAIARISLDDFSWVPDTMDRTAAESPNQTFDYPILASSTDVLYYHESGTDDNVAALPFTLTTNTITGGKKFTNLVAFTPDSIQTGAITVNVACRKFQQSTANTTNYSYSVTGTTERIEMLSTGRFWQYTVSGSVLGQDWRAGAWLEDVEAGPNE